METETEQHNAQLTISTRSTPPSRWIGEQLTILAEAFGETLTPHRLKVYAADLADISRDCLARAFQRARRECRFFPKIAEIYELAGAGQDEQQDAEGRSAWDTVDAFVRKYVSNDPHGNFGPQHGSYHNNYPKLSDRILDTVRRTGGWKVYACMTDEDFPFVQKRFFEEYAAWTAVQQISPSRMLAAKDVEADVKRLAASKAMP